MDKNKAWPISIAVFYGIFVVALLIFLFFSFDNRIQMVTENYYEKTLTYEDQIERINNTKSLETAPEFKVTADRQAIHLVMPEVFDSDITGKIIFFRPSDATLDQTLSLKLNPQNTQVIKVAGIVTGKWEVQLTWTDGQKEYYYKQILIL